MGARCDAGRSPHIFFVLRRNSAGLFAPFVLLAMLAALVAPVAGQQYAPAQARAAARRTDGFRVLITRGLRENLGQVHCNGVVVSFEEQVHREADDEAAGQSEQPADRQPLARLLQGTADQFVFGPGSTATVAETSLDALGHEMVIAVNEACWLTPRQRRTLELAASGEKRQFFDRAEAIKTKFERYEALTSIDQFREWAAELDRELGELHAARAFEERSLFAKILNTALMPEQAAALAGRPLNALLAEHRAERKSSAGQLYAEGRQYYLQGQYAAAVAFLEAADSEQLELSENDRGRLQLYLERARAKNVASSNAEPARQAAGAAQQVALAAPVAVNDAARLETVLKGWEAAAAKIERLDCDFYRFRYDATFEVEKHGTGSLALDRQGRALYKIAPPQIAPGQVGRKKGKNGQPFALQADQAERWHWTGKSIFQIDDEEHVYQEIRLDGKSDGVDQPPESSSRHEEPPAVDRGAGDAPAPAKRPASVDERPLTLRKWVAGLAFAMALSAALSNPELSAEINEALKEFPLARPFLLGMPVAELKERFDVTLTNQTDSEIWLTFKPKQKKQQARLREAFLILKSDGYLPSAVKIIDPAGGETVHSFRNLRVNAPGGVDLGAPPKLDGYRPALAPR
jgi:hypothetical protein